MTRLTESQLQMLDGVVPPPSDGRPWLRLRPDGTPDDWYVLSKGQWVPRGHYCRANRDSVCFAVAHAICEGGSVLNVASRLTPAEFHAYAQAVDKTCTIEGDIVCGRLMGFEWQVKIRTI